LVPPSPRSPLFPSTTLFRSMAIFQMGAIALPLSHLFGPEALEYRVNHAEASVAIVEPMTLANLWAIKDRLTHLRHVIGVGGAREDRKSTRLNSSHVKISYAV